VTRFRQPERPLTDAGGSSYPPFSRSQWSRSGDTALSAIRTEAEFPPNILESGAARDALQNRPPYSAVVPLNLKLLSFM
jgi:hypothetical protein